MKRLAAVLLLAAASAHADGPGAASPTLTFQGAIELSLGRNPDVVAAREAVRGADARTAEHEAKRWVRLNVTATLDRYREAYALDFAGSPVVLHEALTTTTVVSLNQPLTGLVYLSALVGAAEHDASSTRQDLDRVKLETAYKTADAYIRVLAARTIAIVAHQTVEDIQRGLERATQLRQADTYTDIDVLRFRSAKAAADQTALRAETVAATSLASLTVQLGLPDGAPIAIADDLPLTPPPLVMSLQQAQVRALGTRPELASAHEKIAAYDEQRTAAKAGYVPDIRAVAAWQHVTGVQPFQPSNDEYIGLTAAWNVWDWGATHAVVLQAESAKTIAEIMTNGLVEQVKLEVRRRWLEANTQFDSLAVAAQQQQTAEEAFRLMKVRLDNAAATTTDVLDAETDVARARLAVATARYDYYLALVGLARSVGDLPKPE